MTMPETTQSDLVERLTEMADLYRRAISDDKRDAQTFADAAAEITRLRADSERLRKIESQTDGGRFDEWPTATFAGQLRMQSRDSLDPEYSQFMAATANRMESLRAHCEAMAKALETAHDLLECVEQRSADNMWWVNADDPETACGDAYHAVDTALDACRKENPDV